MKTKLKGYTITEMVLVMLLLAILTGIVFAALSNYTRLQTGFQQKLNTTLDQLPKMIDLQHENFASKETSLNPFANEEYT